MQSLCCPWWLHPAVDRAGHGPPLLVAEHRAIRVVVQRLDVQPGTRPVGRVAGRVVQHERKRAKPIRRRTRGTGTGKGAAPG